MEFESQPVRGCNTMMTFGPGASVIRRRLGPIAWVVLECLAESAVDCAGELVSFESVRGIAELLGLSKGTVARALRRLADEELVTYVASRQDDGRFGPSHYRLTVPPTLFGSSIDVSTPAPPKPHRQSRQPRPVQLSLIDAFALDV